jgi:hypothetical protein
LDNGPGESKVAQLNTAILVNQDVGRLEVPVHDASRVEEVNAAEHVVGQVQHLVDA